MTPADIAVALIRTTLATSAAALAAWALLAWLRIDSPRIHRTAWLLVIAQGWLFFPLTIEIETASPPPTKRAAGLVPEVIAEQGGVSFEDEAEWGRGPFAISDSLFVENSPSQKAPDPVSLVLAAWLLGTAAIVTISAYRYWQVLRTLPLGSPPDEPTWQAEWRSALAAAKLRRRQTVDLRVTATLGPLLHWAPWFYLILVPRDLWSALASPERQAILRHELAHLRRHDLWKSLAIRVLALPQWFNPLVWFAVRRYDEAAEWACDDAAAATAAGRLTFAASLLQSAEYAVAPYPASAPAARGVLTRRIHRLVSPRFKEESKMKLLIVPMLLVLAGIAQTIRVERVVAAETPEQPPRADEWSLAKQFIVPLGERLKHAEQRHAQLLLLAERQRQLDAVDSKQSEKHGIRHPGPPLSQDQLDYDELAKEFENFKRVTYVIEPPDVLSIRIDYSPSSFNRLDWPISDAELPRLKVAECMDKVSRRYVVGADGCVRLDKVTSVYVAGMTLREAEDAIQTKLAPQGLEVAVRLSVAQFNSKGYYVITQRSEHGDDVTRLQIPYPVDGRENVAEALARIYDNSDRTLKLKELADASLTLVRPAPNGVGLERAYPIVWDASTQAPTPLTNHGILPGDRIFVKLKREGEPPTSASKQSVSVPPPPQVAPSSTYKHATSNVPPSGVSESYRLQAHDSLKLRVIRPDRPAHTLTWGDFEGEFTVNHHGEIELGQATGGGAVAVAGMTAKEACSAIEQQLRKELPGCELQLALSTLAAEKYVISIQRADGTELAVGALRPDYLSKSDFLEWPHFHSFIAELTPIGEVKLERADRHGKIESIKLTTIWDAIQAPQMPANDHPVRPGDRLVVTVADDWQPRVYPSWVEPRDVQRKRGQTLFRIGEGWSQVGGVKFDHPDVQRPAPYYSR